MENPNNIFDQVQKRNIHVPEKAYFDGLADSILDQQSKKIVPLYKKPLLWISSAAAAAIVLLTIQLSTSTKESQNWQSAMNEISQESILAYVNENIEDFEIDDITEQISPETVEEMVVIQPVNIQSESNLSFEDISNDEIMEYLMNEDLELEEMSELELFFI